MELCLQGSGMFTQGIGGFKGIKFLRLFGAKGFQDLLNVVAVGIFLLLEAESLVLRRLGSSSLWLGALGLEAFYGSLGFEAQGFRVFKPGGSQEAAAEPRTRNTKSKFLAVGLLFGFFFELLFMSAQSSEPT